MGLKTFQELMDELGRDYEMIEWFLSSPVDPEAWTFYGNCSYINGKIIPLDDEAYYLGSRIEKYEYDEHCDVLSIFEKVNWVRKDEI